VTGGWIKLPNEELHTLYSSPSIIRIFRYKRICAGHVARIRGKRNVYRLLVGKSEGRRPLRRQICRYKIYLVEIGSDGVD
jgi:hypothetical protein